MNIDGMHIRREAEDRALDLLMRKVKAARQIATACGWFVPCIWHYSSPESRILQEQECIDPGEQMCCSQQSIATMHALGIPLIARVACLCRLKNAKQVRIAGVRIVHIETLKN